MAACPQVLFEFHKALLKCGFWGFSSKQSHCFAFTETIFRARWMAWVEMCILKGFSRFVVIFAVQNGFFFLSFSFEHHCVEESNLVLWYFGREFDGRVEFPSFFNKYTFFACTFCFPNTNHVIKLRRIGPLFCSLKKVHASMNKPAYTLFH